MPPKAADKKPAASKAPATASKAPEKKDAGKKTAASGDKKKRTKARKETYSSYIYKGQLPFNHHRRRLFLSVTRRFGACTCVLYIHWRVFSTVGHIGATRHAISVFASQHLVADC